MNMDTVVYLINLNAFSMLYRQAVQLGYVAAQLALGGGMKQASHLFNPIHAKHVNGINAWQNKAINGHGIVWVGCMQMAMAVKKMRLLPIIVTSKPPNKVMHKLKKWLYISWRVYMRKNSPKSHQTLPTSGTTWR